MNMYVFILYVCRGKKPYLTKFHVPSSRVSHSFCVFMLSCNFNTVCNSLQLSLILHIYQSFNSNRKTQFILVPYSVLYIKKVVATQ